MTLSAAGLVQPAGSGQLFPTRRRLHIQSQSRTITRCAPSVCTRQPDGTSQSPPSLSSVRPAGRTGKVLLQGQPSQMRPWNSASSHWSCSEEPSKGGNIPTSDVLIYVAMTSLVPLWTSNNILMSTPHTCDVTLGPTRCPPSVDVLLTRAGPGHEKQVF